jgi:peptide/nickel transport system permease protein
MSEVLVPPAELAGAAALPPPETPWQRLRREFFASKLALLGLALLLLAAGAAVFAPWLAPQNPYDIGTLDIFDAKLPPGSKSADGSITYWLGTDGQARDLLSAIFYGLRTSLMVGAISVAVALAIGSIVGLAAAYFSGWVDSVLMRIVDIQLSFPAILVALILLAILGKGVDKVIIALIIVQWAYFARAAGGGAAGERESGGHHEDDAFHTSRVGGRGRARVHRARRPVDARLQVTPARRDSGAACRGG